MNGLEVHVPKVPVAAVSFELGHGKEVGEVEQLSNVVFVDDNVARVAERQDGVKDLVVFALVDSDLFPGRLVHLQLRVEPGTGNECSPFMRRSD